jgi:hypothetical protein
MLADASDRFLYTYDFGDAWEHELIAALADPRHDDHAGALEWLGPRSAAELDPVGFDLARVNKELIALVRPLWIV